MAAVDDGGWLLYHSAGRFPGQRAALPAALVDAAAAWCAPGHRQWDALLDGRARFLAGVAAVMGVDAATVFPADSVTQAFQAFLDALPADRLRGRRVLVAADCFPSLYWLLEGLAPRLGFTLDCVPARQGAAFVEEDDLVRDWDEGVGLALVTWVTSTASSRCDLARLAAHGRRMGSLVAVDATQGLGIVPQDFGALALDFVAGSALKWLCGLPGAAFGQVSPALLPLLEPRGRGWFGKADPFEWDLASFRYAPDARRFGSGTPAPLAAIGSVPGIEWVARTGVAAHRAVNLALSGRLIAVAGTHGLRVASPLPPDRRGGSVMVELPPAVAPEGLVAALAGAGLYADARGRRLRLSPGICTAADVPERLDHALRAALGRSQATCQAAGQATCQAR